jgi:fatty acid CoA ligase FadD32
VTAPPPTLVQRARQLAAQSPDRTAYTFVDYQASPRGQARCLTWAELDRRAMALAAVLRRHQMAGERAAVLAPQGLDYVVAMLGAFYARVIAVPLFAPELPRYEDRLTRVIADAAAACVLTTSAARSSVTALLGRAPAPPRLVLAVDAVEPDPAAAGPDEQIGVGDIAYLQYTSGSTRQPAGVIITHGCLAANTAQIAERLRIEPGQVTTVGWLPLFHDMGFVLTVAMPMATAAQAVFMDPAAFLMRPARWLQLASGRSEVFGAGPNFAYDYCAARIGADAKADLDLSGVRALLNGAEPVRPATMRRFAAAFAGCGLSPRALTPAYGLAEATVYVSSGAPGEARRIVAFDRRALERGTAIERPADPEPSGPEPAGPERAGLDSAAPPTGSAESIGSAGSAGSVTVGGTISLVSCGRPGGQHVAIVEPTTRRARPAGQVGEIWVNGPNVSPGYFRPPSGSREMFGAALADAPQDLPSGGWLRTGDAGMLHGGELFVTGRLKDLIIVDGRNHYPQDVEVTAQDAHPAIRRDRVAAFAAPVEDGPCLVILAERARPGAAGPADLAEVTRAVRAAVSAHHGIGLRDFRLLRPGAIPRTSSGKIARSACLDRYLAGDFIDAS